MDTYSIAGINSLPEQEKRDIFIPLIPDEIFKRFSLPEDLIDAQGNALFKIIGKPGGQSLELYLYHQADFPDPLMYCQLTDTLIGQMHILMYVMNDPTSPRFNVDKLADGTKTAFATRTRNLEAEQAAMEAGLLPGQIRKGLNILSEAVESFEHFVQLLGHNLYFNEPLFYHNAIIFERYGFSYQRGKRKMEEIHRRFQEDEELVAQLGTNPFRRREAQTSIFYRSWAIHDGILGERFDQVTMYKQVGKKSHVNTTPEIHW